MNVTAVPYMAAGRAYCERLEAELAAAQAAGQDLAVSDWESEATADGAVMSVKFVRLEPLTKPPEGRGWTVYATGGAGTHPLGNLPDRETSPLKQPRRRKIFPIGN